ncbi:hypothetical protein ACVIIV_007254 [Bradyrhizobium sp. USDA 4354]
MSKMKPSPHASRGRRSSTIFGLALFFFLFTWGIKFDFVLGTTPLWFYVSIPLFLICIGRIGALTGFVLVAATTFALLLSHLYVATELTGMSSAGAGVDVRHIGIAVFASVTVACLAKGVLSVSSFEEAILLAVRIFLPVQLAVMIAQTALGYSSGNSQYQHYFLPIERQGGILREPSHVGIMLSIPISILLQFPRRWIAEMGWLQSAILFMIVVLCPSATLIVSVFLNIVVLLARSNRGRMVLLAAMIVAPSLLSIAYVLRDQNPIFERIIDLLDILSGRINGHQNVSSIVYAKSVYVLQRVMESYPFGFGLDNYIFANWTYGFQLTTAFGNINERDGSSAVLKFLTEFGGAGLLLFLIVLVKHTRDAFGSGPRKMIGAIFLNLLIGNVIRGAGYFDGGFLLAFAGALTGNLPSLHRRPRKMIRMKTAVQVGATPS